MTERKTFMTNVKIDCHVCVEFRVWLINASHVDYKWFIWNIMFDIKLSIM